MPCCPLYFSYFLIFSLSLIVGNQIQHYHEELPFEELSSEDLTFKELEHEKFVLHFNDLHPNSEGESLKPPSLPDKKSETYELKLHEDQLHLENALNTFKIAKANLESQKDLGKELSDFHVDNQYNLCQTLMGQCDWSWLGLVFCVLGKVCFVIQAV